MVRKVGSVGCRRIEFIPLREFEELNQNSVRASTLSAPNLGTKSHTLTLDNDMGRGSAVVLSIVELQPSATRLSVTASVGPWCWV